MTHATGVGLSSRRGMADPALIGIVVTALLARWVAAHLAPQDLLARTWEYDAVARNLIDGKGFVGEFLHGATYHALILPFYPALCAAVYAVMGHPSLAAMQAAHAAAVVPAGWFAYDLGSELGGRRVGLLAAAGMTLHPALMLYSLRRHALWVDAVMFLMLLWVVFRARRSASLPQSVAIGALFGLALLARTTIAGFVLVACGWLVWQWKKPLRASLPHVALIMSLALLISATWLVRNAMVLGRPTGFISTTSYNLWIGNNPAATGGALAADGRDMAFTNPALIESARGLGELEQQDIFWREAVAYIANNPGRTLVNYGRKLRIFLLWSPQVGAWYPESFRLAYQFFYLALLGCAALGAFRLAQSGHWAAALLCVLFVLSVGLIQSLFFVEGRHRWEVESALVMLASCGIGWRPSR